MLKIFRYILRRRCRKVYKPSDFQCKCNGLCDKSGSMDVEVLEAVETMARRLGEKLVITSAFRCPQHNHNVGGVPDSKHLFGLAVDLEPPSGMTPEVFAKYASESFDIFENGGIGLYDTFVHLDNRGRRARWDERTLVEDISYAQ